MSSLFKRNALPLLAAAAAATLCVPVQAATASWAVCQAMSYTNNNVTYDYFNEQVDCALTGYTEWQTDVMYNNRLGGGDNPYLPNPHRQRLQ